MSDGVGVRDERTNGSEGVGHHPYLASAAAVASSAVVAVATTTAAAVDSSPGRCETSTFSLRWRRLPVLLIPAHPTTIQNPSLRERP